MPIRTSFDGGTPCWVDLTSPDVDASIAFYGAVFGWAVVSVGADDGWPAYTLLTSQGQPTAGLRARPTGEAGQPQSWNTYIACADLQATAEAVGKAGGQVVVPSEPVGGAGVMAICTDPGGVPFRLWQAGTHPGAGIVNNPDAYCWNELASSDVATARDFYAEVFGWQYNRFDKGPDEPYWIVHGEPEGLAGLMPRPAHVAVDQWVVYFAAADIAARAASVHSAGGRILHGPEVFPGIGQVAWATDLLGALFGLWQPPS